MDGRNTLNFLIEYKKQIEFTNKLSTGLLNEHNLMTNINLNIILNRNIQEHIGYDKLSEKRKLEFDNRNTNIKICFSNL